MTYKTNDLNYNTRNVSNFSDFIDSIDQEKSDLKNVRRSMNKNNVETQSYTKNSKYKFNHITRKMDDMTIDEIDDDIDSLHESNDVMVSRMYRLIEDYEETHSPFECRGFTLGIEILKDANSIEDATSKILDEIDEWKSSNKGDLMPEENRQDIIKGLNDLLTHL